MANLSINPEFTGMNDVRAIGQQLRFLTGTFDFDSSYPTGGEDFDLTNYFGQKVIAVIIPSQDGYIFEYNKANDKIKAYYADYDASTDGALIEVADGTDLSSVTDVNFIALGL